MKKSIWTLGIFLTSVLFIAQSATAAPCGDAQYGSAPVLQGASVAYDAVLGTKKLLVNPDCQAATNDVILYTGDPTRQNAVYVFNTYYLYNSVTNKWTPLVGGVGGSQTYTAGGYTNRIFSSLLAPGKNYVAVWIYIRNGNQWVRGCTDVNCTGQAGWYIQSFTRP